MPTFDQLPAEQRAIIELVVQRGRSYEALADALGITPARVRELARDALVELSPVTSGRVDPDRRAQLADFVLRQQEGAEATATEAHLRRSEPARAWTLSLLDSLEGMYADGAAPEVPEAEGDERPSRRRERGGLLERERVRDRERPRERPRRAEPVRRGGALSPEATTAVRNRRILGAVGGLLVIAAATVGIVALVGGDDDKDKKKAPSAGAPQVKPVGQLLLNPLQSGSNQRGIAIVAEQGDKRSLIVQARLTPTKQGQAYEVWLYNSDKDAVSLGAQVTDQDGNYQGAGELPAPLDRYKFVDVSLEQIDNRPSHSGRSVLRGAIADMQEPPQDTGGGATGATGPAQPTP